MRTLNKSIATAALAMAALLAFGQAPKRPAELMVGDDAPPLSVAKWVKGTPVDSLEKGKVYVVEFWATWCGPCKVSIPHLTELHKKFGDKATFIGVSSFENDWSGVEPFVKQEGDQMDYDVATDKVANQSDREGFMANHWMEPAHQQGIPTAFVVDRDGKIAWIGHPMNLEGPLKEIVSGTWDRNAYATKYADDMEKQAKLGEAMGPLNDAVKAKNWTEAFADLDKAAPYMPDGEEDAIRLQLCVMSRDAAKYSEVATKIVNGKDKDNPQTLNQIAWMIVDPKSKFTHRDLKLARKAAEHAVAVDKRKDPQLLDTLAWTYHWLGEDAKAASTEQEALTKAADTDKSTYAETLKTFQAAAKGS